MDSINFSEPAVKSHHDRMAELVEHMLALRKQLAATKLEHEKTLVNKVVIPQPRPEVLEDRI